MLLQHKSHVTNAMGSMLFLALSTYSTGSSIKEFALIKMEKSNDLLEFFLYALGCTSNTYMDAFLTELKYT